MRASNKTSRAERAKGATMSSVHIRWMIRRDMPEVMAIEEASFAEPWSEDDFVRSLRQRNCIGMVAEIDERVVGYMVYYLEKTRLDLANIAVHPDFRRRGVATAMINKLKGKLQSQRRNRLRLIVGDWNLRAQVFFRACGMLATEVEREAFYDGSDAYRFEFALGSQSPLGIPG